MSKSDINFRMVVGLSSENPDQPPQLMVYSDDLHPLIGRIISNWSLLEQEMDLLIYALLFLKKEADLGWQKRAFNKRWDLLRGEWTTFSSADTYLGEEWSKIQKSVSAGKLVRDSLAHKRIVFGMSEKGNWIRFQSENRAFPWSKRYYKVDFKAASAAIASAAGRLFRLTEPQYAKHFPQPAKSLLERLPRVQHLRFPAP